MELFRKTTGEKANYSRDFSREIPSSETLVSGSVSAVKSDGSNASDLTFGTVTVTGNSIKFDISGGTDWEDYIMTVAVVTGLPRVVQVPVELRVRTNPPII